MLPLVEYGSGLRPPGAGQLYPLASEYAREKSPASPSRGPIRPDASVTQIVRAYQEAGARAVSVLTDAGGIHEYARHLGHADLLRERIDGRIGQ